MSDQHDLEPLENDLPAVYKYLFWYWRKRGNTREDAEDLAQEGTLKALCKGGSWKGKSKRLTFLITVGIRAGLDYLKKENRHRRNR